MEKKLEILKYGDDTLKLKAREVSNIDEKIVKLVEQMRLSMYQSIGIGLAAPQIGESIQLAIMDLSLGENADEFMILLNPRIVESRGEETSDEGCLSFPGISVPLSRKTSLLLKAMDINGKEISHEFEGLKARVIQHEIDHLNGTLIIDNLSPLKRRLLKKEINRLKKNGKW